MDVKYSSPKEILRYERSQKQDSLVPLPTKNPTSDSIVDAQEHMLIHSASLFPCQITWISLVLLGYNQVLDEPKDWMLGREKIIEM